jgi:dipeptidyl aminopeptidase/acylaminoacyl peptidase
VEGPSHTPRPETAILVSIPGEAVYLVDPVTGDRQVIDEALAGLGAGYATWAPHHRTLAYGNAGVVTYHPANRVKTWILRGDAISAPAFSPEGDRLVFTDGATLQMTPLQGPAPAALSLPQALGAVAPAWRPGSAIAFQGVELECRKGSGCVSTDQSEIWTIQPDGSAPTPLTLVGHAESPKWSPDGKRLLFIRRIGPVTEQLAKEAWFIREDGTIARFLPVLDVAAADWSPDGSRIALVRQGEADGTVQVWVVGADGSGLHPIGTPFPGASASVDW